MPFTRFAKKPLLVIYAAAIVVLLVGAWLWWARVSIEPKRVFHTMLAQSLATTGVTIQASQNSNGALVQQTVQYSFGNNMSHAVTRITQNKTVVVDETIGTATADYTRYLGVQTDQKTAAGKPIDFSKVVGVWATNDPKDSASHQLFGQAVIGSGLPLGGIVVPVGDVPATARKQLLQQIESGVAYQVDYRNVKHQSSHGRLQYVYDVQVEPVAYASLMQRYAQAMGLHDLDQLDPSNFTGQAALHVQITVDARAGHVVAVALPQNHYSQTYGSYDIPVEAAIPAHAITITELQSRLANLR